MGNIRKFSKVRKKSRIKLWPRRKGVGGTMVFFVIVVAVLVSKKKVHFLGRMVSAEESEQIHSNYTAV